tara:strand:- start:237 stop:500 length:264 start_codon:yes stop_codon:yes gene_type:complete
LDRIQARALACTQAANQPAEAIAARRGVERKFFCVFAERKVGAERNELAALAKTMGGAQAARSTAPLQVALATAGGSRRVRVRVRVL